MIMTIRDVSSAVCQENGFDYRLVTPVGGQIKGVVVLVHGLYTTSLYLLPLAQVLARAGYVCYVIDLPGRGLSDKHKRSHAMGIGDYTEYVVAFIEAIVVPASKTKPLVLGHSMGGLLVLKVAEVSKHVGGVVSITPSSFRQTPREHSFVAYLLLRLSMLLLNAYKGSHVTAVLHDVFVKGHLVDDFVEIHKEESFWESLRVVTELAGEFISLNPSAISAPVLVIGAGKDTLVPEIVSHKIATYIGTQAHYHLGEDFGHMVPYEEPDAIASIMMKWHRASSHVNVRSAVKKVKTTKTGGMGNAVLA
jgi:alpha-beta hydrolase superfamily lysophospholipase